MFVVSSHHSCFTWTSGRLGCGSFKLGLAFIHTLLGVFTFGLPLSRGCPLCGAGCLLFLIFFSFSVSFMLLWGAWFMVLRFFCIDITWCDKGQMYIMRFAGLNRCHMAHDYICGKPRIGLSDCACGWLFHFFTYIVGILKLFLAKSEQFLKNEVAWVALTRRIESPIIIFKAFKFGPND